MKEIFFESHEEVITFCERLFYETKRIELYWKTHENWGNQLIFKNSTDTANCADAIAIAMAEVFIEHRLNTIIEEVVKNNYHYTDAEEISRIHDLCHWIVTGTDQDSDTVRGDKKPISLLHILFKTNIETAESIHFDSIIKFRLNAFKEQLIYLVGLAIDEYKREEEHQTFIDMLRGYIARKNPVHHTIYVLQGNSFSFFKQNGQRFNQMELRNLMKQQPLYTVGLDENEWNLAPLIALAPKHIKIYGDNPSEPKTLTVINVFQEKVTFKPYHKFPFPGYLKNT